MTPPSLNQGVNKWIVGEVEKASLAVTAGIEAYRFNEAAGGLYRFVWNIFCDWYLELIKPSLQGEDEAAKGRNPRHCRLGAGSCALPAASLHAVHHRRALDAAGGAGEVPARPCLFWLSGRSMKGLVDTKAEAEFDWVIRVVSEIRSLRSEMNMPGRREDTLLAYLGQATRLAPALRQTAMH